MKRTIAIFLALLISAWMGSASSAEPLNAESSRADLIKGKIEMLDSNKQGTLPRITRPEFKPGRIETAKLQSAENAGFQPSDLLKSRVFKAAGLGFSSMSPLSGKPSSFGIYSLSAQELKRLGKYDLAVLIDASGSMSVKDCESLSFFSDEGKISRWEWCKQQTSMLSEQISGEFPSGITVTTFASGIERFTNVAPDTIGGIFSACRPAGATRLDLALAAELNDFLQQRLDRIRKKPLLIAVITDGVPSCPHIVEDEVVDITHRVNPGDVKIVFFLIGDARMGSYFIERLSNMRFNGDASFEVVSSHSFSEVADIGLPRSLARSISGGNK